MILNKYNKYSITISTINSYLHHIDTFHILLFKFILQTIKIGNKNFRLLVSFHFE